MEVYPIEINREKNQFITAHGVFSSWEAAKNSLK